MTNGEAAAAALKGWLIGLVLSPISWVLLLQQQRAIVMAWAQLNWEAATGDGRSYSLRALVLTLYEYSTAFHAVVLFSIFVVSATLLSHYFKWSGREVGRRSKK